MDGASRLIFTADDFGLSEGVNEAVERASRDGVLTHASLMVAGPAAADAVSRARRLPGLSVGLHLVAVEGPAVLPRAKIPHLVDATGWFPADQPALGLRYTFSPAMRRELAREIEAQFAVFAATGLPLSHADAHKHMHLHPYVGRLLIETGRRYGLRRVRVPAEPPALLRSLGETVGLGSRALDLWSWLLRRQVRAAGMVAPDAVFGVKWSGHMTEARVLRLLRAKPWVRGEEGSLMELYCHPATSRDALLQRRMPEYEHTAELAALLSPVVRQVAGRSRPSPEVR